MPAGNATTSLRLCRYSMNAQPET